MRPRSRSPPSAIPGSWSTPRATGTRGGGPASAWSTCSSSDVTGWARRRPAGCASTLPEPGSPTPSSTPARTSSPGTCWCAATGPGHRVALLFDDPVQAYVGDARRAQGRRRLRAARPRIPGRPHRLHRVGRRGGGRAVGVASARPAWRRCGRRSCAVDETARQIGRAEPYPADRAGSAGRRSTSWPTSSTPPAPPGGPRAWRSSTRASATSSGWPPRSTAYRPDDRVYQGMTHRLRLLRRGDLGAVGGRRDARAQARRVGSLLGRRPARVPHRAPGHRAVLRADAAGHPRGRPARAALPAGVRRGLPARPDRAAGTGPAGGSSTSTGPTEATVTATWTVVDPDRAGDHRRAAADLLRRRSSTPTTRAARCRPGEVGEIGIAGIGLARGYVNRDDLTDAAFVPDFLGHPGQPVGPHLPHRRPRPGHRRRRDRVPRPHRPAGQDPRLPRSS